MTETQMERLEAIWTTVGQVKGCALSMGDAGDRDTGQFLYLMGKDLESVARTMIRGFPCHAAAEFNGIRSRAREFFSNGKTIGAGLCQAFDDIDVVFENDNQESLAGICGA